MATPNNILQVKQSVCLAFTSYLSSDV